MSLYRTSRNIEASTIHEIELILIANSWSGVSVEKTFAKVYSLECPVICVRVEDTTHNKIEIGSNSTQRDVLVFIDIFAENDGQRLDLKDTLIESLKKNWTYYEYEIGSGAIKIKTQAGRLTVIDIRDTPINFDVNKNNLDVHDRYRHLLTFTVSLNIIEE